MTTTVLHHQQIGKRAVIYARYSSKMQTKTSIEGQIMICRRIAERLGLIIIEIYIDEAKTGQKEKRRDAYQRLLADARARKFDFMIVEMWNRLTRGPAAILRLWQMFDFNKVKMVDQRGVPMTETDAGVAALYNAIYRPQLADFVRRGQRQAIADGKYPGPAPYGYRAVEGKKGYIERCAPEAKIIVRIYTEYVAGRSPRDIARDLTAEGVPTPGGQPAWIYSTITSGRRQGRGIIGNPLYTGEVHWLTRTTVVNPETEKDERRATPADTHAIKHTEALRIVPQGLFDAAQKIRSDRAVKKFGPSGRAMRSGAIVPRNANHPLAGSLQCACCKGGMRIAQSSRNGAPRAACANAHQRLTCEHSRSFDMDVLLDDVAKYIDEKLTTPNMVSDAFEAFKARRKENSNKVGERTKLERLIRTLTTDIERISHAIAATKRKPEALYKLIDEKDAELADAQHKLNSLGDVDDTGNVVAFNARSFADVFCQQVRQLVTGLRTNPRAIETRLAFKTLVGAVQVHPSRKRMPYRIEVMVNGAAFGMRLYPEQNRRKPAEIAASACYDNAAWENSHAAISQHNNRLISLGEWQRAA